MTEFKKVTGKKLAKKIFGSEERIAKICGVNRSAVSRWKNNSVPVWHREALIDEAKKMGFVIKERQLMGDFDL